MSSFPRSSSRLHLFAILYSHSYLNSPLLPSSRLRGGKKSNFEGGVRVNAFVSGGFVPESQRGRVEPSFIASEDWYTTFCAIAGVDPTDDRAALAGLPPIDGVNLWPLLSGANSTSPRTEIWLGSNGAGDVDNSQDPILQGIIDTTTGYKALWGNVIENTWTSAFYPNTTTSWCDTCPLDCGSIDNIKCLFNILDDPTEHNNIVNDHPDIVKLMQTRFTELTRTIFAPDRGTPADALACKAGNETYDGFVGPFTD